MRLPCFDCHAFTFILAKDTSVPQTMLENILICHYLYGGLLMHNIFILNRFGNCALQLESIAIAGEVPLIDGKGMRERVKLEDLPCSCNRLES
jgi:hypothetical protein